MNGYQDSAKRTAFGVDAPSTALIQSPTPPALAMGATTALSKVKASTSHPWFWPIAALFAGFFAGRKI